MDKKYHSQRITSTTLNDVDLIKGDNHRTTIIEAAVKFAVSKHLNEFLMYLKSYKK